MMKFCLLSSTGGSVAHRVWKEDERFRKGLSLVVTDRQCGAADFANENAIPLVILSEQNGRSFSDKLAIVLSERGIDFTFCFFTRLLQGDICETFGSRIFNFHPSLLPGCPGMRGFDDSLASGALFIGCTVHVINDVMDSGKILMQSALSSRAAKGDLKRLRHQIYNQQCAQLLQVFVWAQNDRIYCNTNHELEVRAGDYSGAGMNIPSLDDNASRQMAIGRPTG